MSSIWLFLRIDFGDFGNQSTTIGPSRAAVLEAIDRYGSLSAAASSVNLPFRMVWEAVQKLNKLSDRGPLVGIRRTGRSSGAFLTEIGKEVVRQFYEIQQVVNDTLESHLIEFETFVGLDSRLPAPVPRYIQVLDPSTTPAPKKKSATRLKKKHGAKKSKRQKPKASRRGGQR